MDVVQVVNVLTEFISNLGFPIACVCAMFYMWNKEREEHAAEARRFTEAINNNTQVMNEIKEALTNGRT